MLFKINVGDWSSDGHGKKKEYTVSSKKTLEDVREAHFGIESKTGFNIHSIVNEYEVDSIKPEKMLELFNIEGFKEHFKESLASGGYDDKKIELLVPFLNEDPEADDMYEDEFEFYPTTEFIAELWIFLLNKVDPHLNLSLVPQEKIPSLNFYGSDKRGRHIQPVGYGLFD